jgi:DNA primase catalytic subunit
MTVSLTDYLTQDMEREGFRIENDEQATWALKKLKDVEEEIAKVNKTAEDNIERIKVWQETQVNAQQRSKEYFTNLLMEYHMALYEEDSDKKTIHLPYGDLTVRKQQTEFVKDDETFNTFVKMNYPEYVVQEVKEKISWGEFKKRLAVNGENVYDKETGEQIIGVTAVERAEKFDIKLYD